MPLTEKGFERLTFDECLDIWIDRAKLMFGDDIDTKVEPSNIYIKYKSNK